MNSRMPGVNGYGGYDYDRYDDRVPYGRPPPDDPYPRRGDDPYRNEPRYGREPPDSYAREGHKPRSVEDPYRHERGAGDSYGDRRQEGAYDRSGYASRDAYSYSRGGIPDDQRSMEDGYEVDHLATFTVGPKQGLMDPADGIAKLRHMESSTGIWTMRVQLVVDSRDVIIYDKATGDEMERFALNLVHDPTAVTNRRTQDHAYNNIVLFTVMEDMYKRNPTEMHLFQSVAVPAETIVDEIRAAKEGRLNRRSSPKQTPKSNVGDYINRFEEYSEQNMAAIKAYRGQENAAARNDFRKSFMQQDRESVMSERTDKDVDVLDCKDPEQMLNHCFDDIEKFVGRLQQAAEAFKELEVRRKGHDKRKRGHGEGMLTMRARPPPAKDFIDIFQKFKLSFNLLAKLKPHIHDPNAPELVHFLFTPLSLVVEASKDPRNGAPDLAAKVISPLLTPEAKELLLNCLTSKEVDLWTSLGDAWTVSSDEWKGYAPPYFPKFSDGWTPAYNHPDPRPSETGYSPSQKPYSYTSGDQPSRDPDWRYGHDRQYGEDRHYDKDRHYEQNRRHDRDREYDQDRRYGQDDRYGHDNRYEQDRRYYPDAYDRHNRDYHSPHGQDYPPGEPKDSMPAYQQERPHDPEPVHRPPSPTDPWEAEQRRFLQELKNKRANIYEAIHERTGRNAKELTLRHGEILEVINDTRNWWKLRNSRGEQGHAPYTILQPYKGDGVRGK